jgi:hypothetical protein
VCSYTDGDHDDESSNEGHPTIARTESGDTKKIGAGVKRSAPGFKASALGTGPPKAKEKKLEDERELLKIKIGESILGGVEPWRLWLNIQPNWNESWPM